MDFKANIEEIRTVCNKIDDNNSSLVQEISKAKKIVDEIPSVWKDNASTTFNTKSTSLLKSLQSLASVYESISAETKKAANKYEKLDSTYASKVIYRGEIKEIDTIPKTEIYTNPRRNQTVYYSKKYGGEYYVCRFNESTGKNEYYPASADFGRDGLSYAGDGGKLVIRKFNEKTGKYYYIDSPTSTIPKSDLEITPVLPIQKNTGEYYIRWFNESTGQYQYMKAPEGFQNGDVKFAGGAALVVRQKNEQTGKYEYVDASTGKVSTQGGK